MNLTKILNCYKIKKEEREERRMFANRRTHEMISNLKGRISKILTYSKKLSEDEKIVLSGIYNSIDEIILWNKKLTKNKSDQEQAVNYISKAIEINPEDASYYNNRGNIYEEMRKYDLAKNDFETAISIDPENYEAYANLARWNFAMMRLNDNQEKREEFRENALSLIEKAVELNYEDSQNLKRISDLLKDEYKIDKEIKSLIETSVKVNERSGDIDYQDENYISAISGYSKALSIFNDAPIEIIQDNIDIIKRICEKVYKTKAKVSDFDTNYILGRKLFSLIISIIQIAYGYYEQKNYSSSGVLFECATTLEGLGTPSSNNLAYMIRRGEYNSEKYTLSELLNYKSMDDSSSFLRINRAICLVTGNGFDKSFEKALEEIIMCNDDLNEAVKWWGDIDQVGEKESNLVYLLLLLMDKLKLGDETCDENEVINDMVESANQAGYDIPANAIDLANAIKNGSNNA